MTAASLAPSPLETAVALSTGPRVLTGGEDVMLSGTFCMIFFYLLPLEARVGRCA